MPPDKAASPANRRSRLSCPQNSPFSDSAKSAHRVELPPPTLELSRFNFLLCLDFDKSFIIIKQIWPLQLLVKHGGEIHG